MPDEHADDDHQKTELGRPVVKQDHPKSMRRDAKDHWQDTSETMDEAPAASPNAEQQSRKS
ncbi:hypothetical protein K3552_15750 [Leisingera aquaemixtae]|uniref:hypothetical protein n=1 Tax=Leisingera aquaemixtae TaxID=1396826 RepID=UPI0021A75127|nr:hypothetical protein [Leisingera aquaemixtae]UWQ36909.1 hypothetical protein K3552_15750 [Leisingera aquaemixtae]